MNWKALLNPWGEARRLRAQLAYLEGRCDEIADRAEYAEERAFRRASEHYYARSRMVEEQLKAQQQLVNIANLQPTPLRFPDSILATMRGENASG